MFCWRIKEIGQKTLKNAKGNELKVEWDVRHINSQFLVAFPYSMSKNAFEHFPACSSEKCVKNMLSVSILHVCFVYQLRIYHICEMKNAWNVKRL